MYLLPLLLTLYTVFFCSFRLVHSAQSAPKSAAHSKHSPKRDELVGGPLLLTPFINNGSIEQGRNAARVDPLFGKIDSYAGFLTVNEEYNGNLFFWYFPAEENLEERGTEPPPVMVWLQGGPGLSSLGGLFFEHGPAQIMPNMSLAERRIRWSKHNHVIYIDSPVGTGFSFSDAPGYVKNEEGVARDLYSALTQFFRLFPDLVENDFFVAGESYGGRYVPALAYAIHSNNPESKVKINLKGIAIGDGYMDEEFMVKKGEYLAQHGLIDIRFLPGILKLEQQVIKAIQSEDYETSNNVSLKLESILGCSPIDNYNYLLMAGSGLDYLDLMDSFFARADLRETIHVGNASFNGLNHDVHREVFKGDEYWAVSPYVRALLEHYRVLYYNGQLDVIITYPNAQEFTDSLEWSGSSEYRNASRQPWYVGNTLAGFVRSGGNLTTVLVRDAGHMVPTDQPQWAFELITSFFNNWNITYSHCQDTFFV